VKFQYRYLQMFFVRSALSLLALLLLSAALNPHARAQKRRVQIDRNESHSSGTEARLKLLSPEVVERAMSAVCYERKADPLGSVPIDEMQARPSLPLGHPDAVAGAKRATRLLPVARELTVVALRRLGSEYHIEPWRIASASRHVRAVMEIEPDMELRDNASVTLSDPYTISFGTIFLAGLRSDEGMISVLAHELVHIGDGRNDSLRPLFRQIGRRAASLTNMRISGRRPEELTSDLVGAMAARAFITRIPKDEPLTRRLARLVEHNCVDEDETDDEHLSPRNTMRALLALNPALTYNVIGLEYTPPASPAASDTSAGRNEQQPRADRKGRFARTTRRKRAAPR
jgi:hypothetical protein